MGKTLAGAAEASFHTTGLYPDWWEGRVIEKANNGWAAGVTSEVVRDSTQRLLIGPQNAPGTGFIPERLIVDLIKAKGIAGLMDTILVKHVSGGISRIKLKYYEQGREKFQAETIDWGWPDEEPPEDIYSEMLTRTNATGGFMFMTFTPLLGMSSVVRRFLLEPSPDRADINMTIDDVTHISESQKKQIISSYPAHEREARTMGTPILGSGRIFPVAESEISIPAFEIPSHWVQLGALDFGWDHPTAGVRIAWDRDADCVYITHCYRVKEQTPVIHASALKSWGDWLPWAWPHDGLQHDKQSGVQLKEAYRNQGLKMMPENAQYVNGSNGVEAGLMDMLERMQTGRFKVFSHLNDWFEEFRLYHREDGKVIKEFDDLMSATRYGIMSLRFGIVNPRTKKVEQKLDYGGRGESWLKG